MNAPLQSLRMPSEAPGCQSQRLNSSLCMPGAQTLLEVGHGGNVRVKLQGGLETMFVIINFNVYRAKILAVYETLDVMIIPA